MKRILKAFVLISILLLCIVEASAQSPRRGGGSRGAGQPRRARTLDQSKGYIFGVVLLSSSDGTEEETPGTGAVVTVVTARRDTMYTTADTNGRFRIQGVPVGGAHVRFSMMGYEEISRNVTINPGENKYVANLKPVAYELQGAVVRETVPPLSVVGDTLVFNAAAVKVNKGEMAIDILEQMPGVEVSDNSVSVLNEEVKNVYVDGALLFGSSPMKALNNLAAEEVVTISSYQEYANKDPLHKIRKTEEKERVLNVSTKSKPKMVLTGDFIAGAGFDTDTTYHKFRYTLGGTVNASSERLQANVKFNVNNINDASNRQRGNSFRGASAGGSADLRALTMSAGVTRKWMSPTVRNFVLGEVGGSYSFSDKYDVNESVTQMVYFPSDQFETRQVDKKSFSSSTDKVHSVSLDGVKSLPDGSIGLSVGASFTEGLTESRSSNYNTQDGLAPQGTSNGSLKEAAGRSYNASLSYRQGFADRWSVHLSASYSAGTDDTGTARQDTTTSTITHQVIDISGVGDSRSFNVSPSIRFDIDDCRAVSFKYRYSSDSKVSEQIAYDVTDPGAPVLDEVNTHSYITDKNVSEASIGFENWFDALDGNLKLGLSYVSVGRNYDESTPVSDTYDKRFNSLRPMVSFTRQEMIHNVSFSYGMTTTTPSLDQVRPRINNTNLYSVSAGNLNLVQSRTHDFKLAYSTVLGDASKDMLMEAEASGRDSRRMRNLDLKTLSFNASFSTVQDPIVRRAMYYSTETYLPQYDYTMPAQSTFTTYENVSASYSASATLRFDTPVSAIMCMFNASASMNWDSAPSYVNYVLTRTDNYKPSLRLGIRSNFSRNIRINLSGTGSYVYSDNSEKDATSYFMERVNLGWEINNIFGHAYLGGNYFKTFTQGLDYGRMNDNILNLNAGVRFGPRNNFDLSVSVHDLFNTTTGFSTSMTSNYITNKWAHSFGRYVMFTLYYRFNNMRHGR